MTNRQLGAGIGATVLALAAAGIGLGMTGSDATASPATAQAKIHTQTFTSRSVSNYSLGKKGHYVELAKDVKHGTVIGADSSSGTYHAKTRVVTGDVSIQRKGGLLTGKFTLDISTHRLSGEIVGGLGKYQGVTGTISGHAPNDKVTKVTISYHG